MIKIDPFIKKRIYAFYIDLIMIAVLVKTFNTQLNSSVFYNFISPYSEAFSLREPIFNELKGALTLTFYFFYFLSFYALNQGQTVGKTILGIKKVNKDGSPISLYTALKCCSLYLVGYLTLFIPFLLRLKSHENRHIIDRLSGTKVVNLKEKLTLISANDNGTKINNKKIAA